MIFNSSIMSGTFPDEWKISNIVPIPKKSSPSSPSDFRPISLLPLTSKIVERHLFNWLQKFCGTNNILSPCQFGFRPHFSTESALLTTTKLWFSLLDSGSSICAIFFDLQILKAFDSVPHEPLLDILSKYNLPSHITRWFRSYLTRRSEYVVVDGSVSSKHMVTSGVPQGSIPDPLLFILYLNDISTLSFPSSISLTLYADDILLSYPFQSSSDLSLAQCSIDLLSSWLKSRYLTVNVSKTKYMIISRKPSSFLSLLPSLFLDNSPLECVSNFKYLGVILTSQLSWTPHIDHICSKSKKTLGTSFPSVLLPLLTPCSSQTLLVFSSSSSHILFFSLGPLF